MVDDFWGEAERMNFMRQMKRVFPDREPKDVSVEHPIFHCVYDLKEKPQVPSIATFYSGRTTERADAPSANFLAFYDNNNRMMAFICHNTDLADGWERMKLGGDYAKEYSIRKAIPMGTNVVFYALTQKSGGIGPR